MNWATERACGPIAEHYGIINQLNILQEECGELIQAASKYLRRKETDGLVDEIADVEIMIAQIKHLLGDKYRNRIESTIALKIARQNARIAEEGRENDSTDLAGLCGDSERD